MKNTIYQAAFGLLTAIALSCAGPQSAAPEWAWTGFERPAGINPIISPDTTMKMYCELTGDSVAWEGNYTFNPAAAVCDGKIAVLYRAEDLTGVGIGSRTSRLGYATSTDGLHFQRFPLPVLYPAADSQVDREWKGGVEDPRIAKTEDGLYVMFYTQSNHKVARLAIATSRDLRTWEKHGPAFAKAYDGRFADLFTKSASVVTRMNGDDQVIARINGKYLMYWGEEFVNVATSDNLVDWTPMLDERGELLRVFEPREGHFDSNLTECGPPAIITDDGILLFYNGKNMPGNPNDPAYKGDKNYTAGTYCAGQALFDAKEPTKLLDRLDEPFFIPEASFEKSGQYPDGTVFIEGLVFFGGKWYLYYGCADSHVAVAVYDPAAK